MKKKNILFVLACCAALTAGTAFAQPMLVAQPFGAQFYVQASSALPAGWFATYDGRPVASVNGTWVYGASTGTMLVPTGYVVGRTPGNIVAAIPAIGAFVAAPAPVHHVQVVPVVVTNIVTPVVMEVGSPLQQNMRQQNRERNRTHSGAPAETNRAQPSHASYIVAPAVTSVAAVPTHVPAWLGNPAFMSVGAWKHVDRMGMLEKPRLPIAWKGSSPSVLFVWTGKSWYQMNANSKEGDLKISDVLSGALYSIVRMANTNNFVWNDSETPALANQAAIWGYEWVGRVAPSNLR